MGNRTGLVVDVTLTQATGTAERETALDMLEPQGLDCLPELKEKHF